MLDRTPIGKWTPAMDDKLRSLSGTMSYAEVGAVLGVTRKAAIGRAWRLGLSNPKPKLTPEQKMIRDAERELVRLARNERRNASKRERRNDGTFAPVAYAAAIVSDILKPVSLNLTFAEIERHQCRWIEGEATPALFCGTTTQAGSSYCPYHHQIVWRPAPEKFRARAAA